LIKTKKVLITGSNGMLGEDILNILKAKSDYNLFGVNRNLDNNLPEDRSIICNIINLKKFEKVVEEIDPEIIIHCAAMVDVDGCENNNEYADKLNIESTKLLAAYKPEKTKLIYISTDSVFDGQKGGYSEESIKNPLNYYAMTKSKAEEAVKKLNNNSIIIRTNIYGFHKAKGKSLVEWALSELLQNHEVNGFRDVYFNPVYTKQLAKTIIGLLNIDFSGIIHVGASKALSKYEFLNKLAMNFNVDTKLVKSISIDDITLEAKRPKNTSLETNKLQTLLDCKLNIDDGINELYRDYIEGGINIE
jgi:dTDP-4-dehydrorhamnose reductase